jgi:ribonuclease BN (tRNA processing enzyme)
VRFTVLGKSPAWQDAGGACSGYLAREGDYALLIDCGNGVFAKLREQLAYTDVDEVLISHIHGDHILDLVPFAYALTLGGDPDRPRTRPGLLLPEGGISALRDLTGVWGGGGLIEKAFESNEYDSSDALELGPIRVGLHSVPHFTATHAVELTAPSGRRLVYGADCRFSEELIEAARGAELLIAEATLREPDPAPPHKRGHMSAEEAGELAARAGVGRLVLTHISDEADLERAQEAAAARFDGPVELAAAGRTWEL